jgi:UPF0176 protein
LRDRLLSQCERLGLTGRIIVAEEGINATLEGTNATIDKFCAAFIRDPRFADVDIKTSESDGRAFPRLSIKVRPEIVASSLPKEIDPTKDTGTYMTPEELEARIQAGKAPVIIDMRNDYEYARGHFKGSLPSGMDNFRDLPKVVGNFEDLKDVEVLPVCTGGVRCEKASAYLKAKGFTKVYQLKGGMHRYMEQYPEGAFEGELYVFDRRHNWHPKKQVTSSMRSEQHR